MMKRIIFTLFLVLFSFVKGNCQINNLKDLLEISELTVEESVEKLQYTWELKSPIQDTSEKGFITERYIFTYNRENKKQILKKCGRVNLTNRETIWLTNFISNDKDLLNRITKNLIYQGFELKGKLKSNSMYEDGNRTVTIQTESENDSKLPIGCYSINVVVGKYLNASYSTNKAEKEVVKTDEKANPKKENDALSSISGNKDVNGGVGGGSDYSFGNRKTITKPQPDYNCLEQGRVVVQVTVDKKGNAIKAYAGVSGTTNTSKCLLDAAKIAAMNTKWEPDEKAHNEQVVKIVYTFSLK